MNRLRQIRTARANGILRASSVFCAADDTGIPPYVLCAFLMQESGGGTNVYGHDVDTDGTPRPFWGHGQVTEANYAAYLVERDLGVREAGRFPELGRRMQGVGPMQLTWWGFQDQADAAGGCWDPAVNTRTGAAILAKYYGAHRKTNPKATEARIWWKVAKSYNGKRAYADRMAERFVEWAALLEVEQ